MSIGFSESRSVNPQVPGSSPGRGARTSKKQKAQPLPVGLFAFLPCRQPVTLHVNLTRLICHTGKIAFVIFFAHEKIPPCASRRLPGLRHHGMGPGTRRAVRGAGKTADHCRIDCRLSGALSVSLPCSQKWQRLRWTQRMEPAGRLCAHLL